MSAPTGSRLSRAAPTVTYAAPIFAALGDETRLRIVARLCASGPSSIATLATGADVSRQAITKHLHALAAAGLARSQRRGRERIWKLETTRLEAARGYLDQIAARWDSALERLRVFVETDES